MTNLLTGLAALATFLLFVGVVWRKVLRDFFVGLSGAIENVNGRPAKVDKAGREVEPAVPSLSVQLSDMRRELADQSEQNRRITAVEEKQVADALIVAQHAKIIAEHGRRLESVERLGQVERITGHVAQAKVFDAITEASKGRGVIDVEST